MKQVISERSSGILLHVSSLPGPYGIGDIGNGYDFIDFLAQSGQSYWQILPLGPTSPVFGNSPYMSFSAFAGNSLFISPQLLVKQGFLLEGDLAPVEFSKYFVEFEQVIDFKTKLLEKAWSRFCAQSNHTELNNFKANNHWLNDYALFMALKKKFNQEPWYEWPRDLRCANKKSLLIAAHELAETVHYFCFEQYLFFSQWMELKAYAYEHGIKIIGDLPIYVGADSVDVWANQKIFELDIKTRKPVRIAGVPPDYFSDTGQRWGNPLYRWNTRKNEVRKQLYEWWYKRFSAVFSLIDVIRIDHFRGFEAYWSIPAEDETAEHGKWKKGPGINFFREIEKRLGNLPVIAEDLGIITPEVEVLRDSLGFPGMKILLFAFDGDQNNAYLPYNFSRNCVVFTGTHDNDTAVGWFLDPDVSYAAKKQMKKFANLQNEEASSAHRDLTYLALSSSAVLCILPMQDVLGFGNDCRMNKPATTEGNWLWRCTPENLNIEVSSRLKEQTAFFGRVPKSETQVVLSV